MKSKIVVAFFALIVACAPSFSDTDGDDIMRLSAPKDGELFVLSAEPSKKDLMSGVSKNLNEIKEHRLEVIGRVLVNRAALEAKNRTTVDEAGSSKSSVSKSLESNKNAARSRKQELLDEMKSRKGGSKSEQKKETKVTKEERNESKSEAAAPAPVSVTKKEDNSVAQGDTVKKAERRLDNAAEKRRKFIDCAMGLLGTKYVYGGKTPRPGIDCSGLVSYSAKQGIGTDMSGNAQMIFDKCTRIPQKDAVPGDLVFFKAPSDSRISHVGIYLGNNQIDNEFRKGEIFLNAASAGPRTGVVVSGLSEPYWKRTLYGFGRFIAPME